MHTLPEGVNEKDIIEAVQRKCGMEPLKVELIPYWETNVKHKGLHFAAISCNSALYKKLSDAKGMNIWWQWCRIDAAPRAMKCTQCGILGHIRKNCSMVNAVKAIREDEAAKDNCIDCIMQNMINSNGKRNGYKVRNTDHRSNTVECPTYISLSKRKLRLWRRSEANAQEAGVVPHNGNGEKDATMVTEI